MRSINKLIIAYYYSRRATRDTGGKLVYLVSAIKSKREKREERAASNYAEMSEGKNFLLQYSKVLLGISTQSL